MLDTKKMEVATSVGRATTALQVWQETLHDWTDPDTYEELKNIAEDIVKTARDAELVMNGQCQWCRHAFHEESCKAESGNYIYDIWCKCSSSV